MRFIHIFRTYQSKAYTLKTVYKAPGIYLGSKHGRLDV
jgi:hypothetical protein